MFSAMMSSSIASIACSEYCLPFGFAVINLSHLDAQIGGIEKIEPNTVYGKDGHL
ncbi:hypothetical protein F3D3_4207 [Fusibacter sp. 3D3]|nr:hypothetical protein F3D3_4207 [Fusibacter sp. 3D3]